MGRVAKDRIEAACSTLLENAQALLAERPSSGRPVVGYLPGGYVPEELIWAAGAHPICLMFDSPGVLAEKALAVLPSAICQYARSLVGALEGLSSFPWDLVVMPSTCQHVKKAAEIYEYLYRLPVFRLGVPYAPDQDFALQFYVERLRALKHKLEELTGRAVTPEGLRSAISLYDRLRALLRSLAALRRLSPPVIGAVDFLKLSHATLLCDPELAVAVLGEALSQVKAPSPEEKEDEGKTSLSRRSRPRVILAGPNLVWGNYEIPRLLEAAGVYLVAEDIFEGIRDYWLRVEAWLDSGRDPVEGIARAYLLGRRPAAFMRNGLRRRLEFIYYLAQEFSACGVVWATLVQCEFFDQEGYAVAKALTERGLPVLELEVDYHVGSANTIRTRLEAFAESLCGSESWT